MLQALKPAMPAIAGFLAFFGVLFAVVGAAMPAKKDPIAERLDRVIVRPRTLEEIEMQAPFMERFIRPLAGQASKVVSRLTPTGALENTQRQLMFAGYSGRLQVSDFLGIKGLTTVLGLGLAITISLLAGLSSIFTFVLIILFGGLGYFMPDLWLRGQISRRRDQVTRALPDAIDLLTISVEAGLGFDLALARVVSKSDNALTREFGRVIQEMRIGVARRDALRALVERTGVDDLNTFISAIIQAEQLGASVANVLRIQAAEMRTRRRQRAERLAHEAPIKMLFPMAFLIFPPIFIVVLGPAIPKVVKVFAPNVPL
ncbi:MAG TPA: type II secretion system F family protein [Ktedonobacterales bacterium]|nr:type II secretion system F family protein [Ktedonobacterales bacterium]